MLLRTPLYAEHRALNARMVDFAGWEMPVHYPSGIVNEHVAVREGCGVFDLSHMGRVHVRGSDAMALAQRCVTRDLARVPDSAAAYALLCNERGGIIDDVIGYVVAEDDLLFVFNASNRFKDIAAFEHERLSRSLDARLVDITQATALIGVQGPGAVRLVETLTALPLEQMPGYSFTQGPVAGIDTFIARTGYTGEDGFELLVVENDARQLWNALVRAGGTPAGLGARDTLRTEAGMPLYGHEIDDETTPYEARLGWTVAGTKADFVGRDALIAVKGKTPARLLTGLIVEAGPIPRPGCAVLAKGEQKGAVSSGTFSPTLRQGIAMALVAAESSEPGTRLSISVRGREVGATTVKMPFVPHRTRPRTRPA